jgi:hypothetical protein
LSFPLISVSPLPRILLLPAMTPVSTVIVTLLVRKSVIVRKKGSMIVYVTVNFQIRMLLTAGSAILPHGILDIHFKCFLLIIQSIMSIYPCISAFLIQSAMAA